MKAGVATLAVFLSLATSAFAAPPPLSVDKSAGVLIDSASAAKLWAENVPANVLKLYPRKKYRFVSDVGGGFNEAKMCIVTAQAMLLPVVQLPIRGTTLVYAPVKSATTFDAVGGLSQEQCQDLARAKLKEAIQPVVSALVAT